MRYLFYEGKRGIFRLLGVLYLDFARFQRHGAADFAGEQCAIQFLQHHADTPARLLNAHGTAPALHFPL